ncbi:SDR family NAD(P)-dependent oxidoreductase [Burkholderia sp. Tr-862]|uniref:SDR family NAD(P)-dependent oxidoreductase n=1 Tax=Burkholderia sp. Tr-862 TaxID=2608331 RepID=UPI0014198FAD|nr:SDR family NAD(P)-dependent oxidoreductase [Burkholderia sp. Tr-862]NIF42275.1 SDR family NAD(P)-dependent oxidoreductase [Burkholderia sp. Tr-862]
MSTYKLANKVVAITGSTGGLGSALAEALHARGARLALFDLEADRLTAQIRSFGRPSDVLGWTADVRDFESIEAAMANAAYHFGQIDVVIANAGIDTMAPMATIDPAAFDRVIDINLNGVWRTFRAGLPFVQQQRGYMLAISSMAAFVHSPLQASYTASKAGVWAMCDSIRLELRHLGIGVGSAHPTFFPTPLMDDVVADPAGRALWRGNDRGFWKMIPREQVVRDIVAGIERRADMIVVPKINSIVAKAPGFFRRFVERAGFRSEDIQRAISLASATGWNDSAAHAPAK